MREERFLITGATGFIGRRLVDRLLQRHSAAGIVCLVLDSSEPRERASRAELETLGVRLIVGDLMRRPVCAEPPPAAEIVFHLAAVVDTDATLGELRCNSEGTDHLVAWLAGSGSERRRRLVYASSVAVMDRSRPARGPLTEESPCTPRTDYGASKLEGEEVIRAGALRDGYDFTLLRFPAVYGPGQKRGGLFDRLAELVARGAPLGRLDWPGICSVGYVDDVVELMADFALRPECANELFVVASAEAPRICDIAEAMARAFGVSRPPIALPSGLWQAARHLTWNRVARRLVPRGLWQPFWRLSLMVDSGFWLDAAKQRRFSAPSFRSLGEGIPLTFPERITHRDVRG